jgi:hypothetical protein
MVGESVIDVSSTPVGGAPPGVPLPGAAPAAGVGQSLGFAIQNQTHTNWCWAAVAVSVSVFYQPASAWTQCSLVNTQLNQATCCQNGSTPTCNQPHHLDQALTRTGNLNQFVVGPISLGQVQAEINQQRVLGVRIGWPNGLVGHFVATVARTRSIWSMSMIRIRWSDRLPMTSNASRPAINAPAPGPTRTARSRREG